jgi:hypothetical protein
MTIDSIKKTYLEPFKSRRKDIMENPSGYINVALAAERPDEK